MRADRRCCAENGLFAPLPQELPDGARRISLKGSMWRYRDGSVLRKSHIRVVRSATTFWRNPGNILVGVLDVTSFAVDAVLRVDYEFRRTRFFHPFIDTGRAITRRWAGKHVMLGFFL